VRLRWALDQVRPRAWSRTESLTRLVLTSAGIPEPVLNHPLTVAGRRFNVDLAWPDFRFGLEYDGEMHRDQQAFADDIRRQEIIQDEPWSLMRMTKADLFDRTWELVRRVERRLVDRGCPIAVERSKLAIPRR
jgi:hypothetical protein